MDNSTLMDYKIDNGEINITPVPAGMRTNILDSGILICSYYVGVKSGPRQSGVPTPRMFPFAIITQMTAGRGLYWNEHGGSREILPGQWITATPNFKQSYFGYKGNFIEDSIGFTGKTVHALIDAGIIKNGCFNFASERFLLPIIDKLRESTTASYLEANSMLLNLLFEIYHHSRSEQAVESRAHSALESLLKEIKRAPAKWWTVSEMAEFCNISENYLRKIFKDKLGVSPKNYIDNLRMNRAVEMLAISNRPISEIAADLGYLDTYHFIRRFSQIMGSSPARYRKQLRINAIGIKNSICERDLPATKNVLH